MQACGSSFQACGALHLLHTPRHLLDLDSWQWKKATCEGAGPTPREGAAADYHAGYMVLFGERPMHHAFQLPALL